LAGTKTNQIDMGGGRKKKKTDYDVNAETIQEKLVVYGYNMDMNYA
jgi:N-acetyl-anhydromuramyl-L-alanine amidase AmpD